MEIMLKCFLKVMFQMTKLAKCVFFRKCWSVLLTFVKVYSISYYIRMMDIVGRSKSIAIVLPFFFCLCKQGKDDSIYSAWASLFHMSHFKRGLDII